MNFKTIVHCQKWPAFDSIYIMESEGGGMIRVTKGPEDEAYLLSDLYVDPTLRKHGLGSLLIEQAIKQCRAHAQLNNVEQCIVELAVDDNSEKFCAEWYQRMGFVLNRCETLIDTVDDEGEWCDIYRFVI